MSEESSSPSESLSASEPALTSPHWVACPAAGGVAGVTARRGNTMGAQGCCAVPTGSASPGAHLWEQLRCNTGLLGALGGAIRATIGGTIGGAIQGTIRGTTGVEIRATIEVQYWVQLEGQYGLQLEGQYGLQLEVQLLVKAQNSLEKSREIMEKI